MTMLSSTRQIVTLFFLLNGLLFGSFVSRLPLIQESFALSKADLGLALLALAMGAVISFPFAGRLADKFGIRKISYILFAIYIISLMGIVFSQNVIQLFIAFIIYGGVHGGTDVTMNAWASDVEKDYGRNIMSSFHASFSLGAGVGAALGAAFSYYGFDYGSHFTILTVASMPIFLLCYNARDLENIKNAPAKHQNTAKKKSSGNFGKMSFALLAFIAFANAVAEGAMADWSAIYTKEIFTTTESNAALAFTFFSISMVIMRLVGDRISQKLGKQNSIIISNIISFSGVAMLLLSTNLWHAYFAFFILGLGYALIMPLVFSTVSENNREKAATAIANISIFAYGGLLLGPPIIGFIAELYGLKVAFSLFLLLAASSAICALFYKRTTLKHLGHHQS